MPSLAAMLPDAPTTTSAALELFDSLPPMDVDAMIGTWRGVEVPTGHSLDGMLTASGWWGKQFVDADHVHPLLFPSADGRALWPLNPAPAFAGVGIVTRLPALKKLRYAGAFSALRPALAARGPKARLRTTRYRGVDTATMIYDQVPVNDAFRRIDGAGGVDVVLGAMDLRGFSSPYFFALQRDESLPVI